MRFTSADIEALPPQHRAEVERQIRTEARRDLARYAAVRSAKISKARLEGEFVAMLGDAGATIVDCTPKPDGLHPLLRAALLDLGLPLPVMEFRFAPPRRYRADYCWPLPLGVIVEIDGGGFLPGGGRHNRGAGFVADMARNNLAVSMGYRVLRVPDMDALLRSLGLIRATLERAGWVA